MAIELSQRRAQHLSQGSKCVCGLQHPARRKSPKLDELQASLDQERHQVRQAEQTSRSIAAVNEGELTWPPNAATAQRFVALRGLGRCSCIYVGTPDTSKTLDTGRSSLYPPASAVTACPDLICECVPHITTHASSPFGRGQATLTRGSGCCHWAATPSRSSWTPGRAPTSTRSSSKPRPLPTLAGMTGGGARSSASAALWLSEALMGLIAAACQKAELQQPVIASIRLELLGLAHFVAASISCQGSRVR